MRAFRRGQARCAVDLSDDAGKAGGRRRRRRGHGGVSRRVGGNFDFAVSFSHARGTSTTPGTWDCAGGGPRAPVWPHFVATGWIGADAQLRANGLVELNFPPPQRAYANCNAAPADVFVLFNAGDGDRVVFSATTGPTAAAFCASMGWKG